MEGLNRNGFVIWSALKENSMPNANAPLVNSIVRSAILDGIASSGHSRHSSRAGNSNAEEDSPTPEGRERIVAAELEPEILFASPAAEAIKDEIIRAGRKLWQREYVDGNGGNISARISDEYVICTPT